MNNDKLLKVTFMPDGIEVFVPEGTLLSKAAVAAGTLIETPCGGVATCGKCRVIVSGGCDEPSLTERKRLGECEIDNGIRLACQAKVTADAVVTIPDSSRSTVQKILSSGAMRECAISSGITKTFCQMSAPDLEDETAEFERLAACLSSHNIRLEPDLNVIRNLSKILRNSSYQVTAITRDEQLIAVEPGNTVADCCGIAYDLGSTTIVGYLMDLNTGRDLAVSSVMNPQMIYGDDLISRINFATTQEGGVGALQKVAVDALNRIAEEVAAAAGVDLSNIYKATVVGNTCMTHLLLGIDPSSLGQSPYVPSVCADMTVSAQKLGITISPQSPVTILPNVAGFVGSDLVGVLLAGEWIDNGRSRLAVDIGTNGEMALLHNGQTYACSAAAGPAFEGAGISCGMRGAPGAIDSVRIGDSVEITTIQNKPPLGLCGSGLVDAIAQMLDMGVIDNTGRMLSPAEAVALSPALRNRLIETQNGTGFVLAFKEESGNGKDVTITAGDVRRLQLAKGSIHAAIQTMIRAAGASDEMLDEILLAGAFGNYIRVESAIRIGLIPSIPADRVKSVGNAAGVGARLALLSDQEMRQARTLAESVNYIELAVSADYQAELMERMMFPLSQENGRVC